MDGCVVSAGLLWMLQANKLSSTVGESSDGFLFWGLWGEVVDTVSTVFVEEIVVVEGLEDCGMCGAEFVFYV